MDPKMTRSIHDMLVDPRPIAGGDGTDEVDTSPEALQALEPEALAELESDLRSQVEEARETAADSDENLARLEALVAQVQAVAAEQDARETAAAERATRAEQALSLIEGGGEDDGETETGDGDGEGDGETEATTETETTTETTTEVEADGDGSETTTETTTETTQPEAVAASAPRPTPGTMARRRPARTAPRARAGQAAIVAAAAPGVRADERVENMRDVADLFIRRHNSFRGRANSYEQIPVVTFRTDYPDDRTLGDDPTRNQNLIAAAVGPDTILDRYRELRSQGEEGWAIIAAGGLCAPTQPRYDLANISTSARPVRDSLASFRADRGGINFITPLAFTEFAGAVDYWDVTRDTSATDGDPTKPCLRVECGTPEEVLLEAITRCLTFGNLGARTFPEQVQDALEKAMAWFARYAEARLLTRIDTASTAVTAAKTLGAARDILTTLDRAGAAYRYRHRTAPDMPLRVILPQWVRDLIRTDLARQIPGDDALNTADAEVVSYFRDRNLIVTWSLDAAAGEDTFDAQTGDGDPLVQWPTEVKARLFHEGAHLYLDGGELDLGIVRDSTLNSTNDYQVFAEEFSSSAFTGLDSQVITIDVCPSGEVSGTADITPLICEAGS